MAKRLKTALISILLFLSMLGAVVAYPATPLDDRHPIGTWYEPSECMHAHSEWLHDCVVLTNRMGRQFLELHAYEAAVIRFSQVLQIGEYASVYTSRAVAYMSLGRYAAGRRDLMRSIKLAPQHHENWYNLAYIDLMQKRYRDALTRVNMSIDLKPADPELYDLRAQVYRKMGMRSRARENERIAGSMREKKIGESPDNAKVEAAAEGK